VPERKPLFSDKKTEAKNCHSLTNSSLAKFSPISAGFQIVFIHF